MRIIEKLTLNDLISTETTGETVYTPAEFEFLAKYAPFSFMGDTTSDSARDEAGRIILSSSYTLDISVARKVNLHTLAEHKRESINAVLRAFDASTIGGSTDRLATLLSIKYSVLNFLEQTRKRKEARRNERQDAQVAPNKKITYETSDAVRSRFNQELDAIHSLFGPVPVVIYGSALQKDTPRDIDTMVLLPNVTRNTYDLVNKRGIELIRRNTPLTCVLFPQRYIDSVVLHDAGPNWNPAYMAVLHGPITIPELSKERRDILCVQEAATSMVKLREALLPEDVRVSEGIDYRMGAKIKRARFIGVNLQQASPHSLPSFKATPSHNGDSYVHSLAQANLYVHTLLHEFLNPRE